MPEVRYDREKLVDVIMHHWSTRTSGCGGCGGVGLGESYPEHVADVYEQSVTDAMAEVPTKRDCGRLKS